MIGSAIIKERGDLVLETPKPPLTHLTALTGRHAVAKFKPIPTLTPAQIERFWSKVDKTSDPNGCHLWTGNCTRLGYGAVTLNNVAYSVHRVAYTLTVGPIPDGLSLDHVRSRGCIHRNCVNPDHLEPVDQRTNMSRTRKATCKNGHVLEGENVYARPDRPGGRDCRQCVRDAGARYRDRLRKAAA